VAKNTITLHGATWNTEYFLDAVTKCREYQWHWRLASCLPRDIVVHRKTGALSFDLTLADDSANFTLVKGGWKKDHCAICHWELFESADSPRHGTGYTNGLSWLCTECHEKFFSKKDFFSSNYDDIT
jgi:hypothetical protein